jgi:hypothetical protein
MSDQNNNVTGPESVGELYEGYKIPAFLKLIWGLFVVWGAYYISKNLVPDLASWLK